MALFPIIRWVVFSVTVDLVSVPGRDGGSRTAGDSVTRLIKSEMEKEGKGM